jgi:flagellar basal body-associated protein FliL
MMSKLKILLPVLLLVGGGAYKFVLAKPKTKEPVPKVHGEVYVLPKDFLVNLSDGRFGKLSVALVFDEGFDLTGAKHRNEIEETITKRIKKTTDVKVHEVLFTDVAVQ